MTSWSPELVEAMGTALAVIITAVVGGMVALIKVLWDIRHQLRPNSGKSLADKIDRIEAAQKEEREERRQAEQALEAQVGMVRADITELRSEVREERTARHDGDQHIVIRLAEAQDKADVDHAAILQHVEQRHQTLRQMIDQALDQAGILEEDD